MSNKSISEKLASYIGEIHYNGLPASIIKKVKYCILDLFASHFAGYKLEDCDPIKKYISSLTSKGEASVWSLGIRTSFTEAAFANSAISHVTVFDDMHGNTSSHFGSMVIPAAFAVGEYMNVCSGKEIISAIVSGYEAGIRVGTAMIPSKFTESGFRPSSTFGVFATAATTGKLNNFDNNKMTNAIGLAANFGVGIMAFVEEGTDDLMYQNGLAARNGILSATLVKNGTKAPRYIFECDSGFCATYGGNHKDMELIVKNMDHNYKIEEVYFKSIPACAFVQSAAKATLAVAKNKDFLIDDIDKIKVKIFSHGKNYPGLDCHGPYLGVMQAQMSNPFTIASILKNESIDFASYQNLNDDGIISLSKKIEIIEDEEAQKRWPHEQVVKMEVYLKDGSVRKSVSNNPDFLSNDGVLAKCRYYLGEIIGISACEEFIEMVMSIEKLNKINKLTKIVSDALPKN